MSAGRASWLLPSSTSCRFTHPWPPSASSQGSLRAGASLPYLVKVILSYPIHLTCGHNPETFPREAQFSLLPCCSHQKLCSTSHASVCSLITEDPVVKRFLAWDKDLRVSDKVRLFSRELCSCSNTQPEGGCSFHVHSSTPLSLHHLPPDAPSL